MRKNWILAIGGTFLLIIICFILLFISEVQIPNVLLSSGIVAIISAIIGVLLTVIVTRILLEHETKSKKERDRDIKIYEQKIKVYSEFTEKMWGILDDGIVTESELKELKNICFKKLVFYLNEEHIKKLSVQIALIKPASKDEIESKEEKGSDDAAMKAIGEITEILQKNLEDKDNVKSGSLVALFNSFKDKQIEEEIEIIKEQGNGVNKPQFWHFNMLGEEQIKSFENDNWVLALIEYGEKWRTNLIKQVKPNDVIFLFRRGGSGYIGVFKVLDPPCKILEASEKNSDDDIKKYDIYKGLEDGADLCSNILVEPIAYNYKGIGYLTVRRRTIERINDNNAVKFLLERFIGNDVNPAAKGKLNENKKVEIKDVAYLEQLNNQY